MKVLTLLQPWASLVAIGAKQIETRSWATKYRGPLAIHASARLSLREQSFCYKFVTMLRPLLPEKPHRLWRWRDSLPLGKIIAVCDLYECVEMTGPLIAGIERRELEYGHYEAGRFAWFLRNVRMLENPIRARGRLGLWNSDLVEAA